MFKKQSLWKRATWVVGLAFFLTLSSSLLAQGGFVLSKSSDFSTNDRVFARGDTLFMLVTAPDVDFTDIDENEFTLKADDDNEIEIGSAGASLSPGSISGGNEEFKGQFRNLLNGRYEAFLALSTTNTGVNTWEWKAKIEDNSGRKYKTEVKLQITTGGQAGVTIQGEVDIRGSDFLVIDNTLLHVDTETVVLDDSGNGITFFDIQVGDVVQILANRDQSGKLTAQQITLVESAEKKVELKGAIELIGGDSLVVVGKTFFVNASTEILDKDESQIAFTALQVGTVVKIEAMLLADGTLLASRIMEEEAGSNEVEFTGFIEDVTDTSIVVQGLFFRVTSSTEILDDNGEDINLSELSVGQEVEIRGQQLPDSTYEAIRIKEKDDAQEEIEVTGSLVAVSAVSIRVDGFTFFIDSETEILDDNNIPMSLLDLRVGFVVQVQALFLTDSTFLAKRIKVEDFRAEVVEISGVIESIGNDSFVIADQEYILTNTTEIIDRDGNSVGTGALQVGMLVEVRAEIHVDETHIAIRVRVEDSHNREIEITGTIAAIGENTLTVSGITFMFNASTEIKSGDGNLLQITDLEAGMLVELEAALQADGQWLAVQIELEVRIEDGVEIEGLVEGKTQTSLTVLGRAIAITGNTVVFNEANEIIDVVQLFIGQRVEVRADQLPGGTLVAIRVKIESEFEPNHELEVEGPVDSIGQAFIKVLGIQFGVDQNTEIRDVNNNSTGLSDLVIGQTVEVLGATETNGVRLASSVKILDVLLLSGRLESIAAQGISLVQRQVLFDANTLILGDRNAFLTVEDLQVGQFVEVLAIMGTSSTIFGIAVRVQDVLTAVNDSAVDGGDPLPENFALLQNYPNPFNPTTSIRFRIPVAANGVAARTQLVIYNLLGQRVRTLIANEALPAGVIHVRQWDGKDGNGRPVASGVFLYKLSAENFTKTKRMTLIR